PGYDRLLAILVAEDDAVAVRARDAGEHAAILQLHDAGQVIRIDRRARIAQIAQHRLVITVDEVRQVGPDAPALTAYLMTTRALALVAEKDGMAGLPIAARQLGRWFRCAYWLSQLRRPRQQQAPQRQRTRARVFVRGVGHVQHHGASRFREADL